MPSLQFHSSIMRLHSSWLMDGDSQLTVWEGNSFLGCAGVSTADLCCQPSITYHASSGGRGRHVVVVQQLPGRSRVIDPLCSNQKTVALILSMSVCGGLGAGAGEQGDYLRQQNVRACHA